MPLRVWGQVVGGWWSRWMCVGGAVEEQLRPQALWRQAVEELLLWEPLGQASEELLLQVLLGQALEELLPQALLLREALEELLLPRAPLRQALEEPCLLRCKVLVHT